MASGILFAFLALAAYIAGAQGGMVDPIFFDFLRVLLEGLKGV